MKLKYKFIEFVPTPSEIKAVNTFKAWKCLNKKSGSELGIIDYYSTWRKHCFFPTGPAVYSASCLDDISDFIGQIK